MPPSSSPRSLYRNSAYGLPIFLSAFLLFALEPLLAKRILPWFGGTAAVWSTCLVFYQTALLAGYSYATLLSRIRNQRLALASHAVLLLASLALLPIGPADHWAHADASHPIALILRLLTSTVGLNFLLLASTSPLLQQWAARSGVAVPYRFFAVSNIASLCALLAYPSVTEPQLSLTAQSTAWSWLYACFVALVVAAVTLTFRSHPQAAILAAYGSRERDEGTYILPTHKLAWFALSACGSTLLLAVTNHITQNVAAVPLLWVLPLAVYLLTFILAFAGQHPLRRALWLRLLAMALGVIAYSIFEINAIEALQISLPIFLLGLFVCCYFCHGELHRLRPDPQHLTSFYLWIAAGGAAGSIAVGLAAPALLNAVYELPLALTLTALVTIALVWNDGGWPLRLLWVGVAACTAATVVSNVRAYSENTLSLRRSFYGSLRVVQSPRSGPEQIRTLFHGNIEHGAQYIQLPRRRHAYTYYGPDSGIGILLREFPKPGRRIAVVGLGTGTAAAYGKPGDLFRFFEINPQVADMAQSLFWYLHESQAQTDVQLGDGRLLLERDRAPRYDVLALDAFSGDAIPVHLLTTEAMAIYERRLQPDGVLIVHVSNDFLDLAPVVQQLAARIGWQTILVRSHEDTSEGLLAADWMLVTRNPAILANRSLQIRSQPVNPNPSLRVWTDDYNNLLQILKTPATGGKNVAR